MEKESDVAAAMAACRLHDPQDGSIGSSQWDALMSAYPQRMASHRVDYSVSLLPVLRCGGNVGSLSVLDIEKQCPLKTVSAARPGQAAQISLLTGSPQQHRASSTHARSMCRQTDIR